MIESLIRWALDSRLVVILLALTVGIRSVFVFKRRCRGLSRSGTSDRGDHRSIPRSLAEEVERQVTIPLEIALAGMPGLDTMRSQSMFQLSDVRCQFEYSVDLKDARQEVLNRLTGVSLPDGVIPVLSPESPTGEILRFTLSSPTDANGQPIYTLNDLKSLLDYTLERRFRRVPRIIDMGSYGGTMKRYEIQPDPERMLRYGVTLSHSKMPSKCESERRRTVHRSRPNGTGSSWLRADRPGHRPVRKGDGDGGPQRRGEVPSPGRSGTHPRDIDRSFWLQSTMSRFVLMMWSMEAPWSNGANQRSCVIVGYQNRLGQVLISKPVKNELGVELLDDKGKASVDR